MSSSQLASKPAWKLLPGLSPPRLLRCAEAEPPTDGSRPAAVTSRSARACRNAACALRTLVLACIACATRLRELRVVEALPPLRQRGRAAGSRRPSAADHAAGTSNAREAAGSGGSEAQPCRASTRQPKTIGTCGLRAAIPGAMVRRGDMNEEGNRQHESGLGHVLVPPGSRASRFCEASNLPAGTGADHRSDHTLA